MSRTAAQTDLTDLLTGTLPRPDDDELLNLMMELEMGTQVPRQVTAWILQQAAPELCRKVVDQARDAEASFATRAWLVRFVVDELLRGARLTHLLDQLSEGDSELLLARARVSVARGRGEPERGRQVVRELEARMERERESGVEADGSTS